jgi:EmrB/QacA subfamily drug resistance transporter
LRHRLVLASVLAGTFIGTLNNSLANVAVLDVARDFDVDVAASAWFVTGYVLGFAVLMPAAGRLVDIVGSRRVYLTGMGAFAGASALVACAPNYGFAATARVVQGVVNAPVLPTVMVTVVAALPAAQRGRAVGMWASVNGAAIALGPPLGGVVSDALGWRAVFWLDVPLALGALALAVRYLPDTRVPRAPGLDLAGGALLTGGLVALMVGLSQGSAWGWGSPATLTLGAVGVVLLASMWRRSQRVETPFVDVDLLRDRRYVVLAGVAGLQMVVLFAALFSVPLLLVHEFGRSVGGAGGLTFLLPVTMVLAGPSMGGAAHRIGARRLAGAGAVLLGVAAALLGVAATSGRLALVVAGLVVLGAGVSAIQSPTTAQVAEDVDERQRGVALGLFHTIRFVAGSVGTAASAAVFTIASGSAGIEEVTGRAAERGFVAAFAMAGGVAVLLLALSRFVPARPLAAPLTPEPV